jgi:hypothetical protein
MPSDSIQSPTPGKQPVHDRIVDEPAYSYEGAFSREAVAPRSALRPARMPLAQPRVVPTLRTSALTTRSPA